MQHSCFAKNQDSRLTHLKLGTRAQISQLFKRITAVLTQIWKIFVNMLQRLHGSSDCSHREFNMHSYKTNEYLTSLTAFSVWLAVVLITPWRNGNVWIICENQRKMLAARPHTARQKHTSNNFCGMQPRSSSEHGETSRNPHLSRILRKTFSRVRTRFSSCSWAINLLDCACTNDRLGELNGNEELMAK